MFYAPAICHSGTDKVSGVCPAPKQYDWYLLVSDDPTKTSWAGAHTKDSLAKTRSSLEATGPLWLDLLGLLQPS